MSATVTFSNVVGFGTHRQALTVLLVEKYDALTVI